MVWARHWEERAQVVNEVAANGYLVGGVPLTSDEYTRAVAGPAIDRLMVGHDSRVLEVGCGTGMMTRLLASITPHLVASDISGEMMSRLQCDVDKIVCPADQQPFPPESFDRILCFGVSQYLESQARFIGTVEHLLNLLTADGILLMGDLRFVEESTGSVTRFLEVDRAHMLRYLDGRDLDYDLLSQGRLKRALNRRWDLRIWSQRGSLEGPKSIST